VALLSSLVATVVSAVFAFQLLRRWAARGRTPAALWWGVSLVMFSVASAALLEGVLAGWAGWSFRVFYLFGAVLNVLWLGLGSVAIVSRRRVVAVVTGGVTFAAGALFALLATGDQPALWLPSAVLAAVLGLALVLLRSDRLVRVALVVVAVFSAVAAVAVIGADFVVPLATEGLPEGREVFPLPIRGMAVAGNAVGSIVVIVSAIASSAHVVWKRPDRTEDVVFREVGAERRAPVEALARWLFAGRRVTRGASHVVRGNLLIALGVIVAAMGGTLSFGGDTTGHAVGLAAGVGIMYLGFVRTVRPFEDSP
jgi:hypothetical protein